MRLLGIFGIFIFLVVILLTNVGSVAAENINCPNRYLTLVNPVRSRSLWSDQSLKPITDQYSIIKNHGFAATWLLQYDTLKDQDLMAAVSQFDNQQEKGVFLEVSADLAKDARVLYPQQTPWFKPNAVFLSGYSQSGRRKLIDQMFKEFRDNWGYYPRSVGAWWIDSYSLQYMQQKYGLQTVMIVADQLSTDNYGIWGQWWGVPYFPSKTNVLTPRSGIFNTSPIAVIQWAQRDPLRAYGDSKNYSNFSLQANDYITQGLDTNYFKEISSVYLDCSHITGQITVGLETGQESVPFIKEYENQLDYLKSIPSLKSVTMTSFFINTYYILKNDVKISYRGSEWELTRKGRSNAYLNDHIVYNPNLSFSDYFVKDQAGFLDRKLPLPNKDIWYFPFWLVFGVLGVLFFKSKNQGWPGLIGFLWGVSSYGLVLMSFYQYGWQVYFGPAVEWLPAVQVGLVLIGFVLGFAWWKMLKIMRISTRPQNLILVVAIFGIDLILQAARYTKLDGQTYLGIITDPLHFIGISFGKNFQFVNQDLSTQVAVALLKFDFQKIWANPWGWLIIYPLIHLFIALIMVIVMSKLSNKFQLGVIWILGILWLLFIFNLLGSDPILAKPLT